MDAIFEAAQIATPVTLEENLRRGHEAMKHVIATGRKEYRAMYRKELGWIAFSWGTPGKAPPEFKSRKEAAEWWANLPGKTNGQKGSRVFSGGRGVSHIIAKRDWEAKWMDFFAGQSGEAVAFKCVEVIAKGRIHVEGHKRGIILGKWHVSLIPDSRWIESREARVGGKRKEEYWLLTGFEVVEDDGNYGIMESAGETGGGSLPACPMHSMPLVPRHSVGAADSWESAGGAGVPRTLHRPTHTAPFADRYGVGAADSGEAVDGMGSSAHLSHPTHAMPTVTRHDVGATDSSATVPAFAESRKPEYGTAGYGFALDI